MSIIRDPHTYERYEKIVLAHGVRHINDLAYAQYLENELPQHDYLGELVREKLIYYPTVTREPFSNRGRITDSIVDGAMSDVTGVTGAQSGKTIASCCAAAPPCSTTCARCWMGADFMRRRVRVSPGIMWLSGRLWRSSGILTGSFDAAISLLPAGVRGESTGMCSALRSEEGARRADEGTRSLRRRTSPEPSPACRQPLPEGRGFN